MCRNLLSVNWDGKLFDCDFNQQLDIGMSATNGKGVNELFYYEIIHENINITKELLYYEIIHENINLTKEFEINLQRQL